MVKLQAMVRSPWLCATLTAAAVAFGAEGMAGAAAVDTFVPVAKGQVGGRGWTLAVARSGGKRCFRLGLEGAVGTAAFTAYCEGMGPPFEPWQRRTGSATDRSSVELDVMQSRVHRVRLLLEVPGSRVSGARWTTLNPERLTPRQARASRLPRNFRFAVVAVDRPKLCVRGVRAFDQLGALIEAKSVPCED